MNNRLILGTVFGACLLVMVMLGCSAAMPSGGTGAVSSTVGEAADRSVPEVTDTPSSTEGSASHSAQAAAGPGIQTAKAAVEQIVLATPYNVGVSFVDLSDSGNDFSVNGERQQLSASMIKLAILLYAFNQIDAGRLSLDTTYTVQRSDIVGGSGTLQNSPGTTVTVERLIYLMISQSDNVATNILIDMLGMQNIQTYIDSLGLGAKLSRKLMDTEAAARGIDNYMSADAVSEVLVRIYDGSAGSSKLIELAKEALIDQYDNVGIVDGVPSDITVAHKTGTLTQARNDGAIVYAPHPYVLSVMVEDVAGLSEYEALSVIAEISKAVYGFWE